MSFLHYTPRPVYGYFLFYCVLQIFITSTSAQCALTNAQGKPCQLSTVGISNCADCAMRATGHCTSFTWNGSPVCSGNCDTHCSTISGACNTATGICSKCQTGFTPNKNGVCILASTSAPTTFRACDHHCDTSSGACIEGTGICVVCKPGFTPGKNGVCVVSSTSSPTTKRLCDANCATSAGACNTATGMCSLCKSGFTSNMQGFCNSLNFKTSSPTITTKNVCDPNCAASVGACNTASGMCLLCKSGFSPNKHGLCNPLNFKTSSPTTKNFCDSNCATSVGACNTATGMCSLCKSGFIPNLQGFCNSLNFKTPSPTTTTKSFCDANCAPSVGACDTATGMCSLCKSGFSSNKHGVCISSNFKTLSPTPKKACDANCATIAGACDFSLGECLICRTGFILNQNGVCQYSSSGRCDSFCATTTGACSNGKCLACISGYNPNSNGVCQPGNCGPYCATTSGACNTVTRKCILCLSGFFPDVNGACQADIVECDDYCSPTPGSCDTSQGTCSLCILGYITSTTGICQPDPKAGLTSFQLAIANISPVGYWRMEGSLTEATVKQLSATYNGLAIFTPSGYPQLAEALAFTNTQYAYVPYSGSLNPPSFTVMFWATVLGSGIQTLVSSLNTVEHNGYIIYCGRSNTWKLDISCQKHMGVPMYDSFDTFLSCNSVPWRFIALTFNKASRSINFYVDGQLALNTTLHSFSPNSGNKFVMGGRKNSTLSSVDNILNGAIDEVAIISTDLPSSAISMLYSLGTSSVSSILQNVKFSITVLGDTPPRMSNLAHSIIQAGLCSLFQLNLHQVQLQVIYSGRRIITSYSQQFQVLLLRLNAQQVHVVQITAFASSDGTSNALVTVLQTAGFNVSASSIYMSDLTLTNTPSVSDHTNFLSPVKWIIVGVLSSASSIALVVGLFMLQRYLHKYKKSKPIYSVPELPRIISASRYQFKLKRRRSLSTIGVLKSIITGTRHKKKVAQRKSQVAQIRPVIIADERGACIDVNT